MCSQADDPTQHVTAHLDLRSIREPCAACGLPKHLDFCGGGEYCSLDDCLCGCHATQHGDTLRAALDRDALYRRIHAIPGLIHHGKGEQCFPITDAVLAALAASATDEPLRAALVGLAFERKSTGELCWCGQTGSEQHFPECLAARRALKVSATEEPT